MDTDTVAHCPERWHMSHHADKGYRCTQRSRTSVPYIHLDICIAISRRVDWWPPFHLLRKRRPLSCCHRSPCIQHHCDMDSISMPANRIRWCQIRLAHRYIFIFYFFGWRGKMERLTMLSEQRVGISFECGYSWNLLAFFLQSMGSFKISFQEADEKFLTLILNLPNLIRKSCKFNEHNLIPHFSNTSKLINDDSGTLWTYLNTSTESPLIFKVYRQPVKPWPPVMSLIRPTGACGVPPRWSHAFSSMWDGRWPGAKLRIHVGWSPDIASVSFTRSDALQWLLFRLKSSLLWNIKGQE